MIVSSVRILSINGDRYRGNAVMFQWDADSCVDKVTADLPGAIWGFDFEMLMYGGYYGGDISIEHTATSVLLHIDAPSGKADIEFSKLDIEHFVELCIDETEANGYVLPDMRAAKVDELLEMIGV